MSSAERDDESLDYTIGKWEAYCIVCDSDVAPMGGLGNINYGRCTGCGLVQEVGP